MPRQSQAEMFIQTLADILDEERQRHSVRMRRLNKASAERFVEAFWAKYESARRPSKWNLQPNHKAQFAARQPRDDEPCTFSFMSQSQTYQE